MAKYALTNQTLSGFTKTSGRNALKLQWTDDKINGLRRVRIKWQDLVNAVSETNFANTGTATIFAVGDTLAVLPVQKGELAEWASVYVIKGDATTGTIKLKAEFPNADGSLTFFCTIEAGLVLRVAHGGDLLPNLEQAFSRIQGEIGPLQLTLGCDCILRNLEIAQKQIGAEVGDLFQRNNTIGFNTYGEQYGGVHVNQTFTGIAIGHATETNHG